MNPSLRYKIEDLSEHLFQAVRAQTLLAMSKDCTPDEMRWVEDYFRSQKTELYLIYRDAIQGAIEELSQKSIASFSVEPVSLENSFSLSAQEHELFQLSRASDAPLPQAFLSTLERQPFSFQRAGVSYLAKVGRVLLADEQGTGKTLQTLTALRLIEWTGKDVLPLLVVCPQSLKLNWALEIAATCSSWSSKISIMGMDRDLTLEMDSGRSVTFLGEHGATEARVVVINYDILQSRLPSLLRIPFRSVALDESDRISNLDTNRTQAALSLVEKIDPEYRFCLTGTPMKKNTLEYWPQLCFLGMHRHPKLSSFCDTYKVSVRGVQDMSALTPEERQILLKMNESLRSVCMVRREKQHVLPHLPPKKRVVHWVEISNRSEYDRAYAEFQHWLAEYFANRLKLVAALLRGDSVNVQYSDMHDDMAFVQGLTGKHYTRGRIEEEVLRFVKSKVVTSLRAKAITKINLLKRISARGKLDYVTQFVRRYMASAAHRKILVFGWHTDVIDNLSERFGYPVIYGATEQVQRFKYVQEFQNDPNAPGMILNIQSAGVGLTLTAARCSVFVELPWDTTVTDQAEDRTHRIGQRAPEVEYHYILGDNTIDVPMANYLERKRDLSVHGVSGKRIVEVPGGRINVGKEMIGKGTNDDFVAAMIDEQRADSSVFGSSLSPAMLQHIVASVQKVDAS